MWRLDLVTKNDHGSSQLDMLRPKRQLCQGQPAGFSMLTVGGPVVVSKHLTVTYD